MNEYLPPFNFVKDCTHFVSCKHLMNNQNTKKIHLNMKITNEYPDETNICFSPGLNICRSYLQQKIFHSKQVINLFCVVNVYPVIYFSRYPDFGIVYQYFE